MAHDGVCLLLLLLGGLRASSSPDHRGASSGVGGAAGGSGAVARARAIEAPTPVTQHGGEFEHADFWEEHSSTLRRAWRELGLQNRSLQLLQPGFVAPALAAAVQRVRSGAPSLPQPAGVDALHVRRCVLGLPCCALCNGRAKYRARSLVRPRAGCLGASCQSAVDAARPRCRVGAATTTRDHRWTAARAGTNQYGGNPHPPPKRNESLWCHSRRGSRRGCSGARRLRARVGQ
jgi:hypothetical protein